MRRYWVFQYFELYPAGGTGDLIGMVDTMDQAVAITKLKYYEDVEIVNVEDGTVWNEPSGTWNSLYQDLVESNSQKVGSPEP